MARSSTASDFYETVSSDGQSGWLELPARQSGAGYVLTFNSAGAFALDLQHSNDRTNFNDMYDLNNNKVTIDTSTPTYQSVQVPAGQYRMDVDTYNNPITMRATPA